MSASLLERAVKRHTVERVLEVLTPAQRHNACAMGVEP